MVLGVLALGLAGTFMAGIGLWLIGRRDTQRAVGVLGVFFVIRGLINAAHGFDRVLRATVAEYRWGLAVETYDEAFVLLLPFLVVAFASLYPRRRGPLGRNRGLRNAFYAVAVLMAGIVLLEPGTLFSRPITGRGPSWLLNSPVVSFPWLMFSTSYTLVGLLFVRDYLSEVPVPDRDGLLFVAVGFMFDGTYLFVVSAARLLDPSVTSFIHDPFRQVDALVVLTVLALLAWRALGTSDRSERRKMAWTILGVLAPVLLALTIVYTGRFQYTSLDTKFFLDGLSVVVFPLLIAYGVHRHSLLELDVEISRGVEYAVASALLVGVYAAASLAAQTQLGTFAGRLTGAVATGALIVVSVHMARRWGGQGPGPPLLGSRRIYLDREKLDVYQGTLEEALAAGGGRLSARDDAMLSRMRERLGISDREHRVLVQALSGTDGGADEQLSIGQTVAGRYQVDAELSQGGHGVTFLAHDVQLDRAVVLKALREPVEEEIDLDAEARRLGSLNGGMVVTVYDLVRVGRRVIVVMEYVPGGSLSEAMDDGPIDRGTFEAVATDALAALEIVHGSGMVHRDVKPGNLLLTEDGRAKLADFGIARAVDEQTAAADHALGAPRGTVRYMSPEQAKGLPVDERSDLFSLAATLYEAYIGEPYVPVEPGESMLEVQMRVAALGPFDREIDGPEALTAWFERALAPRPEDRFESARAMRDALAAAVEGQAA